MSGKIEDNVLHRFVDETIPLIGTIGKNDTESQELEDIIQFAAIAILVHWQSVIDDLRREDEPVPEFMIDRLNEMRKNAEDLRTAIAGSTYLEENGE